MKEVADTCATLRNDIASVQRGQRERPERASNYRLSKFHYGGGSRDSVG